MQRRMNNNATSLIILLSILTIIFQFTIYYFFEASLVIWGSSSLIVILCCHALLEITTAYESCFQYSLLLVFMSIIINGICFFGNVQSFLPYTGAMLGVAIINWSIPLIHCSFRALFGYGTKIEGFPEFFRNTSIVFILIYLAAILTGTFLTDAFPWAYPIRYDSSNLLPFGILSTLIEDYLYGYVSLSTIFQYLFSRILPFVPYGFYITLTLRRQPKLLRLASLLLLPLVIEALQLYMRPNFSDIDDLLYGFLGGVIGSILFYLTNFAFLLVTGREFLLTDATYRFSNGRLHFKR